MQELHVLTALDLRERLARGEIRAVELTEACLERIALREPEVAAWTYLDQDLALAHARACDEHRQSGRPIGALHGVPVGVKDIIDTKDMPTECGTAIEAGRRPRTDAAVVARLRAAGAIILGKTVTAECAYFAPGKTRNPHAPNHTPGGSSSGSAAAVASSMVPVALGTQTAGSVIRPASYCGVVGYKPSFGLISRSGILRLSPSLDTVGTFGRTIEDAALVADVLAGYDPADSDTSPSAPPGVLDLALSAPPVKPAVAFVRTPASSNVDPDCAQGFSELVDALGDQCDEVELPSVFSEGAEAHRRIMLVEMARHLRRYAERGEERLAKATRDAIDSGRKIAAVDYLSALDWRAALSAALEEIFRRYDAIVTPAASGEAPLGLESTGNPAFNVLWSLMGVPAVTLPALTGKNGLPIGVQLIGPRGFDGRLMRTARWLVTELAEEG